MYTCIPSVHSSSHHCSNHACPCVDALAYKCSHAELHKNTCTHAFLNPRKQFGPSSHGEMQRNSCAHAFPQSGRARNILSRESCFVQTGTFASTPAPVPARYVQSKRGCGLYVSRYAHECRHAGVHARIHALVWVPMHTIVHMLRSIRTPAEIQSSMRAGSSRLAPMVRCGGTVVHLHSLSPFLQPSLLQPCMPLCGCPCIQVFTR